MKYAFQVRIGPVGFRIVSDWKAPIRELAYLYRDYPCPDIATATVRLTARNPLRRHIRPAVHIGGDHELPEALPLPLDQALLAAEMGMNLQVALGWRQHLLLHASAVERAGKAVLMIGESGSGKSTLAAQLGESGWRFMGDEFTLIEPDCGDALAFPRLISLKNESIEAMEEWVLARHGPEEMDRFWKVISGTPKGDILHLTPRTDAIAAMDIPARPALLLFPTFGEAPGLRPMPPSEAFIRLTESSTNYVLLGERAFRCFTDLVRNVPAVAISYGSSAQGLEAVEALASEAGI
jgi:HprK-related kinase A